MGEQCDKSVMLWGLTSIAIISATSLVGAVMAPFQQSAFYADFQSCMIAVAVGCLTGDAVLHLIPIIFGRDYLIFRLLLFLDTKFYRFELT